MKNKLISYGIILIITVFLLAITACPQEPPDNTILSGKMTINNRGQHSNFTVFVSNKTNALTSLADYMSAIGDIAATGKGTGPGINLNAKGSSNAYTGSGSKLVIINEIYTVWPTQQTMKVRFVTANFDNGCVTVDWSTMTDAPSGVVATTIPANMHGTWNGTWNGAAASITFNATTFANVISGNTTSYAILGISPIPGISGYPNGYKFLGRHTVNNEGTTTVDMYFSSVYSAVSVDNIIFTKQ